jgi:hypothetical protein
MGKVTEEGAGRTENGKGISGKECREDCWEKCRERFLGDRQENRQERVPGGQSGKNRREDCPKDCRKVSQETVKRIAKKTGGKECREDCPGKIAGKADGRTSNAG